MHPKPVGLFAGAEVERSERTERNRGLRGGPGGHETGLLQNRDHRRSSHHHHYTGQTSPESVITGEHSLKSGEQVRSKKTPVSLAAMNFLKSH